MSRERSYDGREREERRDAPPADAVESQFKAFIGGISYSITDESLREAFSEFDPADAKVMMDRMTGRSRGFGFVWFRDARSLDKAIEKLHNTDLEGRRISVAKAVPQSETAPGTPADLLRRGQPYPREGGRYDRGGPRSYGGGGGGGRYDDRGGYGARDYRGYDSRAYGGYDSRAGYGGYDRAAGSYGGYDSRSGYGGYGDYRGEPPYGGAGAYGGYGGYGGYDAGGYDRRAYETYDDRYRSGGYGADRSHERGGRAGPYDRPPAR